MTDMITIDGSQGEGGGQMLRSSMTLAVVTGTPVRLHNIRAGRAKPGLMRQHLMSVRAAAEICDGQLSGAEPGAQELTFQPGNVRAGHYHFSVGSAGSAMLVLQTVLAPLLTASGPSTVVVEGGTHNQWAPPFEFLQKSYLPLVTRMGPQVTARIERHGFYPAGGGRVVVDIQPTSFLNGFELMSTGRVQNRRLIALVGNLPTEIGEREISRAIRKLNWRTEDSEVRRVRSNGPGNVLLAEVECENVTAIFTTFGRQGTRAEHVADKLVQSVRRWQKTTAPVEEYLADQILLPLGLSAAQPADSGVRCGGTYLTGLLSQHSLTHIDILQRFLDITIDVQKRQDGHCEVTVRSASRK